MSAAPERDAAIFLVNDSEGSRLLLAGGGGRPTSSSFEIWRANEWVKDQYRYGDAGAPQTSVGLRVLQIEKGSGGMGGPAWSDPDRYHKSSAILHANKVTTPLMLAHRDLDFVPIQQAEEFFTAFPTREACSPSSQSKRMLMMCHSPECARSLGAH